MMRKKRRMRRMRRSRTVFRGESLYVLENVKLLRKHRPLSGIETGNSSCCTTRYRGKNVICGLWLGGFKGVREPIIIAYDVGWAVTAIAIRHARTVRSRRWKMPIVVRRSGERS
jgi:hypothetical protein